MNYKVMKMQIFVKRHFYNMDRLHYFFVAYFQNFLSSYNLDLRCYGQLLCLFIFTSCSHFNSISFIAQFQYPECIIYLVIYLYYLSFYLAIYLVMHIHYLVMPNYYISFLSIDLSSYIQGGPKKSL